MAYGGGTLVAVVGAVLWFATDKQLGLILILSGITIAIVGLVMRAVEWAMAKGKRSDAT